MIRDGSARGAAPLTPELAHGRKSQQAAGIRCAVYALEFPCSSGLTNYLVILSFRSVPVQQFIMQELLLAEAVRDGLHLGLLLTPGGLEVAEAL